MTEVRKVGSDDWLTWRTLRLAALTDSPNAFESRLADWQGGGDQEDRWRTRLSIPGSCHVVAIVDEAPVGMASGVPTADDDVVELISMWVDPRVRRQGVGVALVREVERWARSIDAGVLRLSVAEDNDPASAFYLRNGFTYTGEQGVPMADGARRQRPMVKHLPAH